MFSDRKLVFREAFMDFFWRAEQAVNKTLTVLANSGYVKDQH